MIYRDIAYISLDRFIAIKKKYLIEDFFEFKKKSNYFKNRDNDLYILYDSALDLITKELKNISAKFNKYGNPIKEESIFVYKKK